VAGAQRAAFDLFGLVLLAVRVACAKQASAERKSGGLEGLLTTAQLSILTEIVVLYCNIITVGQPGYHP
jgi:hypothetical protein